MGIYFINLHQKCKGINLATINLHPLAVVSEKLYSVEILVKFSFRSRP